MGWKLSPSHPKESKCDTVIASQVPNWEGVRAEKGTDHLEAVMWESRRSIVTGQRWKEPSDLKTETFTGV